MIIYWNWLYSYNIPILEFLYYISSTVNQTTEETLISVGKLLADAIQCDIAESIGAKQNVISRLRSRYSVPGEVA